MRETHYRELSVLGSAGEGGRTQSGVTWTQMYYLWQIGCCFAGAATAVGLYDLCRYCIFAEAGAALVWFNVEDVMDSQILACIVPAGEGSPIARLLDVLLPMKVRISRFFRYAFDTGVAWQAAAFSRASTNGWIEMSACWLVLHLPCSGQSQPLSNKYINGKEMRIFEAQKNWADGGIQSVNVQGKNFLGRLSVAAAAYFRVALSCQLLLRFYMSLGQSSKIGDCWRDSWRLGIVLKKIWYGPGYPGTHLSLEEPFRPLRFTGSWQIFQRIRGEQWELGLQPFPGYWLPFQISLEVQLSWWDFPWRSDDRTDFGPSTWFSKVSYMSSRE